MICTVTCPKCGKVIRPLVSTPPSPDAQCPECGGWFWVSLTDWHAYVIQQRTGTGMHDGCTEQCECEYVAKTNTKER